MCHKTCLLLKKLKKMHVYIFKRKTDNDDTKILYRKIYLSQKTVCFQCKFGNTKDIKVLY